jgi:hypothetical protein
VDRSADSALVRHPSAHAGQMPCARACISFAMLHLGGRPTRSCRVGGVAPARIRAARTNDGGCKGRRPALCHLAYARIVASASFLSDKCSSRSLRCI